MLRFHRFDCGRSRASSGSGPAHARLLARLLAACCALVWMALGAPTALADTGPVAENSTYSSPGCYHFTVPNGASPIDVTATGSAGQGSGGGGGTGDVVSGTLSGLSAGQVIEVCVDFGGGVGPSGDPAPYGSPGGTGGGASGVALGDFSTPVLIAAGGGGGGGGTQRNLYGHQYGGGAGGNAGLPSGTAGSPGDTGLAGNGGPPGTGSGGGKGYDDGSGNTSDGTGTTSAGPGAGGEGANGVEGAGGGGGGYYGGAGGGGGDGYQQEDEGGGGGGSDFCAGSSSLSGSASLSGCGVTGTNSSFGTASVVLSYSVPPQPPAVTSADKATFTTGRTGSFTVTTSGDPTATVTESGALPSGVSFTPGNGDGTATLSGTPAAGSAGNYPITIGASNGVSPDASQSFTLTVQAPPAITSATSVTFTAGQAGSFTVTTTGSPTPSLSETGALPSGVSFTRGNGDGTATLSGKPDVGTEGSYPITIKASNGVSPDASQTFTLKVQDPTFTSPGCHTLSVPSGVTSVSITATGSAGQAGNDYAGGRGGGSGDVVSGTLSGLSAGQTFDVCVDSGGNTGGAFNGGGGGAGGGASGVALGTNFSTPVLIAGGGGGGGGGTYNAAGTGGSANGGAGGLDDGGSGSDSGGGAGTTGSPGMGYNGAGSGSPTSSSGPGSGGTGTQAGGGGGGGYYGGGGGNGDGIGNGGGGGGGSDFCSSLPSLSGCGATGSNSSYGTASVTLTYNVPAPPAITSANSASFTVGQNGSFTVTSTGNPTPSLTESGSLPSGVSFTDNGDGTATLAGTPAAGSAGSYPITITAANGVGSDATQNFTLTVQPPPSAPAITSGSSATFTTGQAGTFTVTTTGNPTPSLSKNGALPSGVTFNDNGDGTATLAGTPAAGSAGSYPITITAANGVGSDATQSFTLTVQPPPQSPAITSANSASFTVGQNGSFTVTSTGNPTPSLTESGSLPSGVSFTDNGDGTATLAGTPAAGSAGSYPITITAANGVGSDATQNFTLTVQPPPSAPAITSGSSATFTTGQAGTFTVTTTGNPTPSLSKNGALPSGVTFNDNGDGTATLAGTPAAGSAGSYPITITASNSVSPNATQNFTLTVQTVSNKGGGGGGGAGGSTGGGGGSTGGGGGSTGGGGGLDGRWRWFDGRWLSRHRDVDVTCVLGQPFGDRPERDVYGEGHPSARRGNDRVQRAWCDSLRLWGSPAQHEHRDRDLHRDLQHRWLAPAPGDLCGPRVLHRLSVARPDAGRDPTVLPSDPAVPPGDHGHPVHPPAAPWHLDDCPLIGQAGGDRPAGHLHGDGHPSARRGNGHVLRSRQARPGLRRAARWHGQRYCHLPDEVRQAGVTWRASGVLRRPRLHQLTVIHSHRAGAPERLAAGLSDGVHRRGELRRGLRLGLRRMPADRDADH